MARGANGTDRFLAVIIAPFVVAWDGFRNVVFGFFALVERFDPFAASWRLVKRLFPWVAALWRRIWRPLLPVLMQIKAFFGRVLSRIAALFTPLIRRLTPLVSAVRRALIRAWRPIWSAVVAGAVEVRRVSRPIVRMARQFWRLATNPVRRASAAVRRRVERIRAALYQ